MFLILMISPALALAADTSEPASEAPTVESWKDVFDDEFKDYGMAIAIENALADDHTAEEIISYIISKSFVVTNQDQFNIKAGLKALLCADASRDTVQKAANKLGLTDDIVSEAVEESNAECGKQIVLDDRDIMSRFHVGAEVIPERPEEPEEDPGQPQDKPKKEKPKKEKPKPASPSRP